MVILQYSDYEGLKKIIDLLVKSKEEKENELQILESRLSFLNDVVNKDKFKIVKIRELESIGFGLQELKILSST